MTVAPEAKRDIKFDNGPTTKSRQNKFFLILFVIKRVKNMFPEKQLFYKHIHNKEVF